MSILLLSVIFAVVMTVEETIDAWMQRHPPRVRLYRARPHRFD